MPIPTFQSAGDGRGRRSLFVNSREVDHVLWCDIGADIVVVVLQPVRVKWPARYEVYTRLLRGQVRVVYTGGYVGEAGKMY